MQLVEDSCLLPPVQPAPGRLSRAEPQLRGQKLPGYVVVEDEQDALRAEPIRHRPRPRRPLRPRRQQRLDQRPQLIVHDPRSSTQRDNTGAHPAAMSADEGRSGPAAGALGRWPPGVLRGQRWAQRLGYASLDADGEPALDALGPSQKLLLKSKAQVRVPITAHDAGAVIPRRRHGGDGIPLRQTRSDLDLKFG